VYRPIRKTASAPSPHAGAAKTAAVVNAAATATAGRAPATTSARAQVAGRSASGATIDSLEPDHAEAGEADGTTLFLHAGSCRFGHDPATSVLDPDCRAHEVPNLYVTDGSFMPTSGGVPLTLTIVANALRAGEKLAARFKKGEL